MSLFWYMIKKYIYIAIYIYITINIKTNTIYKLTRIYIHNQWFFYSFYFFYFLYLDWNMISPSLIFVGTLRGEFRWERVGDRLPPTAAVRGSVLHITRIQHQDAGSYRCTVTDRGATSSQVVEINVEGRIILHAYINIPLSRVEFKKKMSHSTIFFWPQVTDAKVHVALLNLRKGPVALMSLGVKGHSFMWSVVSVTPHH